MKTFLYRFIHSMPLQLLFLHVRRYQILLLFWFILFATVQDSLGKIFGAESILLAPEYLGTVSFYSTFILGISYGIFVVSWQITTFILDSKYFRFLATTRNPFGKYALNNSLIPLAFFIFYLIKQFIFLRFNELFSVGAIFLMETGFILGFLLILFISFTYFFGRDKNIIRSFRKQSGNLRKLLEQVTTPNLQLDEETMKVDTYLDSYFTPKKARNVSHYDRHFLDNVFKKHHAAAALMIAFAFVFLILLSYLTKYAAFRIPAGASVLIFISVLIAFSGAFAYLFKDWTIPVLALLVLIFNWAVKHNVIDMQSKAYGMDYTHRERRPIYSFKALENLFTPEKAQADEQKTLQILNNWKNKFPEGTKPPLILLNVSGGGSRSAAWCMDVFQYADSLLGGRLMRHTVLITGASGGMVAASYYRELYLEKLQGKNIDLLDKKYNENVSKDLLNSIMSSFAVNDFFTPFQNFKLDSNIYSKDRGYAFERQLNINLGGILNKTLQAYQQPEEQALIPMLIFSPTITADGRKLLISPQRVSYLTYPVYENNLRKTRDIDAVDFCTYFSEQNPEQLLFTTAIRMNATFPYVLPNVYLPTKPAIEVMDAGLRDNFGKETSLRFMRVFRDWINQNAGEVILIQIRDRQKNEIRNLDKLKGFAARLIDPLFSMQRNWSTLQDFEQDDLVAYASHFVNVPFHRLIFQYVPRQKNKGAALNWHLTLQEKLDIADAIQNKGNQESFKELKKLMNQQVGK